MSILRGESYSKGDYNRIQERLGEKKAELEELLKLESKADLYAHLEALGCDMSNVDRAESINLKALLETSTDPDAKRLIDAIELMVFKK